MKIRLALVAVFLFGVYVGSQEKPKYAPSEVQTLRLQVKQRDAQLAQRDLQYAQQRFQQAIADLNAEADRIKSENHWPASTSFSPDSLAFTEPSKPVGKSDEEKAHASTPLEKPAAPGVKP